MDATCIRNGSTGDTEHFGLTSLRPQHVSVQGDTTTMAFTGKAGVSWKREFRNRETAAFIRGRLATAGADEPIFGTTSDKFNDYMGSLGSRRYTAKDFRTHHATATAARTIRKELGNRDPMTLPKARRRAIVQSAVEAAAARINDLPATAKSKYIRPEVFGDLEL